MASSTSGSFFLSDGLEVYSRVWEPKDSPIKSHIAFLHGFGDRCDHYDTFFSLLVAKYPIKVHAWDRRGWGKTVRTRAQIGDTGKTLQVIAELHEALSYIASTIPDIRQTPLFLMGHSMGGQESAFYILNPDSDGHRPPVTGWILEAPYIGLDLASHPSCIIVAIAKQVARVFPKLKFTQPLSGKFVTRNSDVRERYLSDPLCHNTGTLEGLQDVLQRESDLTKLSFSDQPVPSGLSARLPCPVLWAHGSADMITSYTISKRLYERLEPHNEADPDAKTWKSFKGAFHQLHSEPDGVAEEFLRDVGEWVARITARSLATRQDTEKTPLVVAL
ncbi:Alpha/Beta hydrolase protein [Aspergillus granulosus]|uniref:Alpha/Beta hydrolase protein n=1 Tax=Aspergillus granulosus TaxID=176169 RepID=A0ABR4GTC5_9EURO